MENYMLQRRYVGNNETAAYIAQDFADSFSIGKYGNRFIWDVVKIDFKINGIVTLFTGAWDVINDMFISAIVDRTRTRWGKFRPFLIWMKIPLTIFGMFYWFMPLFFPNTAATYLPKLIYFFAFSIINETAGTFISISQAGLLSTITPNPEERVRLIAQAKFFSRFLGEKNARVGHGISDRPHQRSENRHIVKELIYSHGQRDKHSFGCDDLLVLYGVKGACNAIYKAPEH